MCGHMSMGLPLVRIVPLALLVATLSARAADPPSYSGIYPHLAFFNDDRECGTGAVVQAISTIMSGRSLN